MPQTQHTIVIAGLGEVAQTHLRALEQTPGAEVIAGIDIAQPAVSFHGHPVPCYRTAQQASARHNPSIVVIATPTPSHAEVCDQIAAAFPAARILIEKPAADTLPAARHILTGIATRQPVDVAYHMAYSPEVSWAARTAQAHAADLGVPTAIEAIFTDPYSGDYPAASSRLGTSWIDSGINALSVLTRFTQPLHRSSLNRLGPTSHSTHQAHLTCETAGRDIDALIMTSWHVTDPAKTTRIRYSTGAELLMDHTAVASYLIRGGQVTAWSGSDRSIPRRERHYLALYQSWLTEGRPTLPTQTSLHLHELLLQPPGEQ